MATETENFDEQRIDIIAANGNDGLHYSPLVVDLADVTTIEQLKDLVAIIFTVLSKSKEAVDRLVLDVKYVEAFPELLKIAKANDVENTTT